MGIKKATAKTFTDYRRQRKDGTYPIKIKITYKGESYEYKLNLYVSEEEDDQLKAGKFGRNDKLKKINKDSISYLSRANAIIDKMSIFKVVDFEKEFLGSSYEHPNKLNNNLIWLLNQRSSDLRQEGRISYSESYKTTANALNGYCSKIVVEDVNVDFLLDFEKYLINRGNSSGSVGVYMRNIRVAMNIAMESEIITKDRYPFGRKKYCIPQQRNNKTAIGSDEIDKIINYEGIKGSSEEKARDFWLFMYLTNGLNMKDVALLRVSDLKPQLEGLNFFRAKTIRTTKHNKIEIDVWYDSENIPIIKQILLKHGNDLNKNENYLFPILHEGVSPTDERRLIQNFTRFVNKNMTKVSRSLNLSSIPKTNVARHSFVTTLINEGDAPLTAIKELVGHSSIITSEGYAGTLPTKKRREYASYLIKKND